VGGSCGTGCGGGDEVPEDEAEQVDEADAAASDPDAVAGDADPDAAEDEDAPEDDDQEAEEDAEPEDPIEAAQRKIAEMEALIAQRDQAEAAKRQQAEAFAWEQSQRIAQARRQQLLAKIPDMTAEEIQRAFAQELYLTEQANQGFVQQYQIQQAQALWQQELDAVAREYALTPEQVHTLNTTAPNSDAMRTMAQGFRAARTTESAELARIKRELKQLKRSQAARQRDETGADRVGSGGGMATRDPRTDPNSPQYDQDYHAALIFGLRRA
jgi:hypothetical protein